jgi:hypothetical protein
MKSLHVQIQPARSPRLDVSGAVTRLARAAQQAGATVCVSQGDDHGRYVNVDFTANDLPAVWAVVQPDVQTIPGLAEAAIACCQGEQGWDDYLLLHHFDPTEALDQFG